MPKKKTGQRKKAEKQKLRQKEIRSRAIPLAEVPCNALMEVRIAYLSLFTTTKLKSASYAKWFFDLPKNFPFFQA